MNPFLLFVIPVLFQYTVKQAYGKFLTILRKHNISAILILGIYWKENERRTTP